MASPPRNIPTPTQIVAVSLQRSRHSLACSPIRAIASRPLSEISESRFSEFCAWLADVRIRKEVRRRKTARDRCTMGKRSPSAKLRSATIRAATLLEVRQEIFNHEVARQVHDGTDNHQCECEPHPQRYRFPRLHR